jgi:hypothetical protein
VRPVNKEKEVLTVYKEFRAQLVQKVRRVKMVKMEKLEIQEYKGLQVKKDPQVKWVLQVKMEHRDSRPELRKGKPELRVEHLEVQRVHPMVRLVEMPH